MIGVSPALECTFNSIQKGKTMATEKTEKRICDVCKLIPVEENASKWAIEKREAYYFDENFAICEEHWYGVNNFIGARKRAGHPVSVTKAAQMLLKAIQAE
jgi:hypothetical protein